MAQKRKQQAWGQVACLVVVALLFSAQRAGALSLTQQFTESFYGPGVDIIAEGFDPQLGTLESVAISFGGDIFYKCITEVSGIDPEEAHPFVTYDIFGSTLFNFSSPLGVSVFTHEFSAPQAASDVSIYTMLFEGAFGESLESHDPGVLDFMSQQTDFFTIAAFSDHTSSFMVDNIVGPAWVIPVSTSCRIDLILSLTYSFTPHQNPSPSPTPEPATWLLFLTGLGGLARLRKRGGQAAP